MSETLGEYIRRHRKRIDLTQEDLARAAGISQSYVSGLERGINKDADKEYLYALAAVFSVSRREILKAAGVLDDMVFRETPLRYITDPDTAAMVEAYEGAPDTHKELVKALLAKSREMEKESSIGGKRSDRDENTTNGISDEPSRTE